MTTSPKKPDAPQCAFTAARRACRTPAEHEQLAQVIKSGWTEAELHEMQRLTFSEMAATTPLQRRTATPQRTLQAVVRGLTNTRRPLTMIPSRG